MRSGLWPEHTELRENETTPLGMKSRTHPLNTHPSNEPSNLLLCSGYAAMKSDFERLLDSIGVLETERQHLEAELEKSKASQQASANG